MGLAARIYHSVTRRRARLVATAAALCASAAPITAIAGEDEHILIADQFNNRVIEVDRETHQVLWHFGDGADRPGPHSVVGTNDAEQFGPYRLISGTGIPPSNPAGATYPAGAQIGANGDVDSNGKQLLDLTFTAEI